MRRIEVLADTDFRRLFVGQTVSLLGDQAAVLALPLTAVSVLHAGAAEVGILTAMGIVPSLLFSLPAGAWVDRWGRRRNVMLLADLARALAVLSLPIAYFLGRLGLVQLNVVAFVVGTFDVAFVVAYQALVVSMVPPAQFMTANSLLNGSRAFSEVIGLSLGGTLVGLLTAPGALLLDGLSFVFSGTQLARIHPVELAGDKGKGFGISAGMRWIAQHPAVRTLLVSAATINLFAFIGNALLVLYAYRTLHLSAPVIGIVFACGAVGGLVGAATCDRLQQRFGLGVFVAGASIAFPAAMFLYPLAGGSAGTAAGIFALGEFLAAVAVLWIDISVGAVFAQEVPPELRSRVAGAYRTVNYGVRPVGALLGGVLGVTVGLRSALLISAAGAVMGGLLRLQPAILRLRLSASSPEASTP